MLLGLVDRVREALEIGQIDQNETRNNEKNRKLN
jgi:hypothetical protein